MKKIFSVLIAVIMCVTLFAACGEKKSEETIKLDETVLLKVDDVEVTQAFYNLIYSFVYGNMSQYQQYYGEDWLNQEIEEGKTISNYIEETTKEQAEQLIATTIYAEKYGITAKDVKDIVSEQRNQIIESYGGEAGYEEFLSSAFTTDEAVTKYIEIGEIFNLLTEKISQEGEAGYISDAEMEEAFYEETTDLLRVQHILIQTTDASTGEVVRSDEEALEVANGVIAKLNSGEDFDSLIPDYNEDPGMSQGQYYLFGTGEMVEEFESASRELAVGKYTKEPVKSDYGYHIIKRYGITTEIPEYENFKSSKKQQKVAEVIEEDSKNLTFEWNDKNVKSALDYIKKEQEKANADS